MKMKLVAACAVIASLVAAGSVSARVDARKPIVTVVRHGGLCIAGGECRDVFRITDRKISGDGFVSRRLKKTERTALLRAIRRLDLRTLRAHPFTGTCPIAYDGQESVYRFRGFSPPVPSCTYDVSRVQAVRLTERLLASLKRKPR